MMLDTTVMNERLRQVILEASSIMFALSLLPVPVSTSSLLVEPIAAAITLQGPLSMTFTIRIESEIARRTLLDLNEEEPTAEQCQDFVNELSNIIAGNFKARLPDSTQGLFQLSTPRPGVEAINANHGWHLSTSLAFECPLGNVEAQVSIT